MKDKPTMKMSISDLVNEYKDTDPIQSQKNAEISELKEEIYTEKLFNDIIAYNQDIGSLDEMYANIKPLSDIIVRVFLQVPEKSMSGLITPIMKYVPIPTRSGVGSWAEIESPFPYSEKAIVVASPEGSKLIPGQIVQLSSNQVEAQIVGNGEDAQVRIKNGYLHPDCNLPNAPKDPTNRHYGYLMVPSFEIKAIL